MSSPTLIQQAELTQTFGLPVITHQWTETHGMDAELRTLAFELMRGERGQKISNVGGWNSKRDLADLGHSAMDTALEMAQVMIRELMGRVLVTSDERLLRGWEIEAWFNVNYPKGYNELHDHSRPPSVWSGIYYVDCGTDDLELSGETVFENCHLLPRTKYGTLDYVTETSVAPSAGTMLIFPASMYHRVRPHQGDRPRITLAFNLSHPLLELSTGPLAEFLEQRTSDRSQTSPLRRWLWHNFRGLMRLQRRIRKAF